jgi:hypothetical protein
LVVGSNSKQKGKLMSNNPPIVRLKNGRGLSLSVFANATSEGKTFYSTPGVESRYFDKQSEDWKTTHRLSESDFLEAAELLRDASRVLREERGRDTTAANDEAAPQASFG